MARPLFCLSSGRCGSTLFQQLLNATGRCQIWGEHGGFLTSLAASFYQIKDNPRIRQKVFSTRKPLAWENQFDEQEFDAAYRTLLEELFRANSSYWGFKEISYGFHDQVPDFLDIIFPNAVFILIFRNPIGTIASQINAWGRDKMLIENRLHRWTLQTTNLLTFSKKRPCHIIRYEDFTDSEHSVLEKLFADLALPFTAEVISLRSKHVNAAEYDVSQVLQPAELEEIRSSTAELRLELGY